MLVASLNNRRNAGGVLRQWVTVRLHSKLGHSSIWTGVFGLSTVCVGLSNWPSLLPATKETVNSSIMRTLQNTKLMWLERSEGNKLKFIYTLLITS
jgi:hypothetical protein